MPDINLLPEELKEKEAKELFSAKKKQHKVKIELSNPQKEKVEAPLYTPKSSLLSRLFAANIPSGKGDIKPYKEKEEAWDKPEAEKLREESLHIPKQKGDFNSIGPKTAEKIASDDIEKENLAEGRREKRRELKEEKILKKKNKKENSILYRLFKRKENLNLEDKKIGPKVSFDLSSRDMKAVKEKKQEFLDVNLIPAEMSKQPESEMPKKFRSSIAAIVISIFVVVISYLGITWYQFNITRSISELENENKILDEEIASFETSKDQAILLQDYLEAVNKLLDSHVYWTKFFELLEKYTIDEVYYTNFSMAGQDKLVISAVGKNYQAVAKQLVAFQEASDFVKSVRIDAASADVIDEQGSYEVNFNIDLEFLPNVFLKADK